MAPNRVRGAAAAFASGVSAGTIASSNGSAIAAPIPRRNVRRGSDIFEMNINPQFVVSGFSRTESA